MELQSRGVWITTILFILFQLLTKEHVHCLGVVGERAPCSNEGDPVAVDYIDKNRCFTCICRNGFVECNKDPTCPNTEGCYTLMLGDRKCKGCWHRGSFHDSSTEWTDPKANCRVLRCEAGVVTDSEMQCHVPCDNPTPPGIGQCCPTCPDCKINGQIATNDRDVTSDDDPCLKCRCTHGRMTCAKKACPVLQCGSDQTHLLPGECCPKCKGKRRLTPFPNTCILGLRLYAEGDVISYDTCTRCKCMNETSICERQSCPVLDCAPDLQKKKPDSCCRECSIPEFYEFKSQCVVSGKIYEEGNSWTMDACSSCKCHRGMPSCAKTICNVTTPCPPGTHLVHHSTECCQKCEESEGVCMVFGDPHYKTFDGKIYSFQGIGKYQLASDCANHSFSIRVTNDFGTKNHSSTLTKRVRIKFGEIRINLGQKFRTTIDGTRVNIPYKNSMVDIEKNLYNIHIILSNNVKILWNGHNFLEIIVPSKYKNKLCGLCGNFNSNVQDDLKLRKGPIVTDANILKFGNSWCLGKECQRQAKRTLQIHPCKLRSHKRAGKNPCKYLSSTELFNGCDTKLNYNKYYHACLKDMCDCPNGKCYCASLMAYAQECTRLGVNVSNWEKNSYCTDDTIKSTFKNKHAKGQAFTKADIARFSKKYNNSGLSRGNAPMIH